MSDQIELSRRQVESLSSAIGASISTYVSLGNQFAGNQGVPGYGDTDDPAEPKPFDASTWASAAAVTLTISHLKRFREDLEQVLRGREVNGAIQSVPHPQLDADVWNDDAPIAVVTKAPELAEHHHMLLLSAYQAYLGTENRDRDTASLLLKLMRPAQ